MIRENYETEKERSSEGGETTRGRGRAVTCGGVVEGWPAIVRPRVEENCD